MKGQPTGALFIVFSPERTYAPRVGVPGIGSGIDLDR